MVMLPDVAWRARSDLAALVAALGGPTTTRLVGGAVRDALLGLPVSDIDMATRLLPDVVMHKLSAAGIKTVPTGLAHGTVTAVTQGGPVEVTTLRRDIATDGRHATVTFSDDWREDAARRDFTINALYADASSGEVFDWFGGLDDLQARRVRFIGDPLKRIAEDHLRILRFFRFHARFGVGEPDAEGLAACVARANDLMALSRERIASESLKLLAAQDPVPVVRTMIDRGVLRPVLPEIVDAGSLARLIAREAAFAVPGDPVRRLAALIGADVVRAQAIGARLKLSNAKVKRLIAAATPTAGSAEALAYRLGSEGAIDRLLLGEGSVEEIRAIETWQRPWFPLSGGELIAQGLVAGPGVARALRKIEDEWVAAGFPLGPAFDSIVASELELAVRTSP